MCVIIVLHGDMTNPNGELGQMYEINYYFLSACSFSLSRSYWKSIVMLARFIKTIKKATTSDGCMNREFADERKGLICRCGRAIITQSNN